MINNGRHSDTEVELEAESINFLFSVVLTFFTFLRCVIFTFWKFDVLWRFMLGNVNVLTVLGFEAFTIWHSYVKWCYIMCAVYVVLCYVLSQYPPMSQQPCDPSKPPLESIKSHPCDSFSHKSQLGCPRKCVFDFRRNTEFFEKHTEFRKIPRNSAVFFAVKLPGIPRNFADFRAYLHTEFRM